ncbi:major facilitator superfamily protein [Secundilactobacillus paracollinoides DSM 15502 = JCM 11969]|nr:major facilitator superfamily protein [Secundilactobacillus paracollinoides DSM 15502 = JCM 11969]
MLLFIGNAMVFMAYNMQVPVLPLYGQKIGLNAGQIGLFVGILMFAGLIVRFFTGQLLTYFSKKTLLLIGAGLYLMTAISYPFFTVFGVLIFLRVVNGLGHGLATTYFATAAADELPLNRMGTGMGYFGVSSMLTASLAPLIAIPLAESISFNAFFVACVVVLSIAMVSLLFLTPRDQVHPVRRSQPIFAGFDRAFIPHFTMIFFLGLVMGGVNAYTTLFAKVQHVSGVAWFFFAAAVVGVLMRPMIGNLFDQRGAFFVVIPSIVALIFSLWFLITMHNTWQLVLAGVFYGAGDGAIFPTLQAWTLKDAGNEKRESVTGVPLNCYDLGMGLGAYLLGQIVDISSYQTMFVSLLWCTVVYLGLSVAFKKRRHL